MAEMKNLTINGTPFTLPFAPAGYGLGTTVEKTLTLRELDSTSENGWYWLDAPGTTLNGVYFNFAFVFVHGAAGGHVVHEVRPLDTNIVLRRYAYGGVFSEWECENPPMVSGVEYRTTERHNGKPVFRKAYALGALPNTSRGHYRWYIDRNATIIRSTMYARKRTSEGTIASGDEQYNGNVFFDLANNSIMACATPWTNGSDWYMDIRSSRDLTYLVDTWGEMAYVKE